MAGAAHNKKLPIKGQYMGQWVCKSGGMRPVAGLVAMVALSGCLAPEAGDGNAVSRFLAKPATAGAAPQQDAQSTVISDLQARQSVLPQGSAYARVAQAVLAANSRSAEAELRAARLRAEAASKNWLPKIGPNISLSSLSEVVATIFVEQVLFDHGRLKAERRFAKADVEVAAVGLAEDSNARVETALDLYLDVQEGRARAALQQASLKDMRHFEWIMQERVKGGVSDPSDLSVLRQKLGEISSDLRSAEEQSRTAMAELNAMSAAPLDAVQGGGTVAVATTGARPLSMLRAEAERDRAVAQAQVDRAGLLPGLTASGTTGTQSSGPNVTLGGGELLGLGTGANLKAIAMERDAADRRVAQAEEDSNRVLRRLEARIEGLRRQSEEAARLSQQAKTNLDLFQRQYDAGQRQVMDVVGVYETYAQRRSLAIDHQYELSRARIELARHLGVLADGGDV